jgi:Uma2 family endonuclease
MTVVETLPVSKKRPLTYAVAELFPRQGEWTEADYWPFAERNRIIELSEGELVVPPMPTTEHQMILFNIAVAMRTYVKQNKLGKVAIAPLPVRLWEGKVREPDIMVMLQEHMQRVFSQYWEAPDLVVEVLSKGTKQTDQTAKLAEYAAAGVAEYWIVSPADRTVQVYRLEGETYTLDGTYANTATIESQLLKGFALPLAEVFAES